MTKSLLWIPVILFTFSLTSFHLNHCEFYGTWKAASAYLGEDLESQKEGLNSNQLELFKEIEGIFIKDAYVEFSPNHQFRMQVGTIGKLNGKWRQKNNIITLHLKQEPQDSLIIETYPDKLVLLLMPERSLKITFTK